MLTRREAATRKSERVNATRQKALSLEESKAKYIKEGFGKTDAGRLARLEISGADVNTIERYKKAINGSNQALAAMRPVAVQAEESNNKLLASIKGIAAYALLSTAIYAEIGRAHV